MRYLLLIRHSKSSWDFPELSDHDRPLNKRGLKNAPAMAQRLLERNKPLDIVISSTAVRAKGIARPIADALEIPLLAEPSLYTFSSRALMDQIYNLSNQYNSVALVGHNPAITGVANQLISQPIDNIPTSGIVAIHCDINRWSKINAGCCSMDYFDYPKKVFL